MMDLIVYALLTIIFVSLGMAAYHIVMAKYFGYMAKKLERQEKEGRYI
jgi:hypothetical protein